jgi:hypothetical protein
MNHHDIQSRVLIYARPSAMDVHPYVLQIYTKELSASQEKMIVLRGKSFIYDVRNIYLSASDPIIFGGMQYSYFDIFRSRPKLHPKNPAFHGVALSSFQIFNENVLYFDIPDQVFFNIQRLSDDFSTFIDVIVENEAGYGLLTRDSYSYRICSWSGFTQEQKPCINGIQLTFTNPTTSYIVYNTNSTPASSM